MYKRINFFVLPQHHHLIGRVFIVFSNFEQKKKTPLAVAHQHYKWTYFKHIFNNHSYHHRSWYFISLRKLSNEIININKEVSEHIFTFKNCGNVTDSVASSKFLFAATTVVQNIQYLHTKYSISLKLNIKFIIEYEQWLRSWFQYL